MLRGGTNSDKGVDVDVDLDLDSSIAVLQHHRCRGLLYDLRRSQNEPRLTTDLAQRLVRMDPTLQDIERALTDLHHTHLPRLQDSGLIKYDPSTGTVVYLGDDRVERLLDVTNAMEAGDTANPR